MVALAVFVPPVSVADAPDDGAVKVMKPPATGSPPTPPMEATSGDPKALKIGVLCGEPLNIEIVKPRDSKAPMSTVVLTMRLKPAPRWSVVSCEMLGSPQWAACVTQLSPALSAGLPGKSAIV